MSATERRLGFVGIIVEDRNRASEAVNRVLSEHGAVIVARLGVPHRERGYSVISVVVDATTDEIGEMTGQLGMIESVSVRSALAKAR
ncbi:MAG: CopG family transcriptional regulator [Lentisphaerae bacterium]|nr:CopG family transcriptional regulator [Lentisphaerota bacterium]